MRLIRRRCNELAKQAKEKKMLDQDMLQQQRAEAAQGMPAIFENLAPTSSYCPQASAGGENSVQSGCFAPPCVQMSLESCSKYKGFMSLQDQRL